MFAPIQRKRCMCVCVYCVLHLHRLGACAQDALSEPTHRKDFVIAPIQRKRCMCVCMCCVLHLQRLGARARDGGQACCSAGSHSRDIERKRCMCVCVYCVLHTHRFGARARDGRQACCSAGAHSRDIERNDACVFVCIVCCIYTGLERVHETGDRRAALLAPIAETLIGDATYMACTSATTPSPAEVIRRTLFFCLTAAELP